MTQTLGDLVQRTITRLSMVPGIAVQMYAEDRIAEMIWHKFVIVRDELWWDDFMDYAVLTQDANGRPVENVVRELPLSPIGDEIVINSYKDVQYAWRDGLRGPLKELPRRSNPLAVMRSGSTLFRMADHDTVIRFAPFAVGMPIMVRYKRYYSRFAPSDAVPMDDQLMILGAAYDYLEDDGTNPGQTEKFRALYNDRLQQLKSDENSGEIPLSPLPYIDSSGYQVIN